MGRSFTDEQIAQANSISIIDYARSQGYEIKRITPHSYKIPGYGGLYIHSNGLKWNRFSAGVGGGTIQFVMHMENKSWVEAVKELLGLSSEYYSRPGALDKSVLQNEPLKKTFILPEKNDTYKHLFAYLIGTRKIDKQLVYDLVKLNKVYENKYYNCCVFVGHDQDGAAKYAAIRGTNPTVQYRKDVTGSDKSYPFAVHISEGKIYKDGQLKSKSLFVFESPIDLMSYLSLLKLHRLNYIEAHCISLGGVSDLALDRFLSEHPHVTEITLCLDNDEAGRFACGQISQKYSEHYNIIRHSPDNKDFNEDLIRIVENQERTNGNFSYDMEPEEAEL